MITVLKKKTFFKKPLALAILAASTGLPGISLAQESGADPIQEEVVVTGFRDSLKSSLNLKRNSSGMVDSILAEDIGDFPDNNLAEAIGRIPGVNITRTNGQGKQVNVRGLSAKFTRVRVNGMEGSAVDFGTTDCSFDFNVFASELFNRIDIKKSSSASMEEGSLGATVELFTARPLDADGNSFVVGGQMGYNDMAQSADPRVTALLSMQNEDGTFGGAFSVAYSDINIDTRAVNSGRWEANGNSGDNQWANAASLPAEVNAAWHPRFPRFLQGYNAYETLGITGTLQFQPSDATLITFDLLSSSLDTSIDSPALTPISLSRTGTGGRIDTTVNSYTLDPRGGAGGNAMVEADLSGVDVRSEQYNRYSTSDFNQYSLTLEQDFSDSLHLRALVGKAGSDAEGYETTAILEAFNQDMAYSWTGLANPVVTYGFDLADPSNYLFSELRHRPQHQTYDFDNVQVDLSWDINDIFTLNGGLSHKQFEFDILQTRSDRNLTTNGVINVPGGCPLVQADLNVTSAMGAVYTDEAGYSWFRTDFPLMANALGWTGTASDACFTESINQDRNVVETSDGYYVQLDFKTELGAMELVGNVGMRKVDTEVESTGAIATVGDVTVVKEYSDDLPALNLGLWATEDVVVRLSWAEVMTRPDLGNLSPGGTIDGFNGAYTAGNPGLDPFRAKATDLSVEWYFSDEALVSLAYFKKDIESFPSTETVSVPWSALGLPDSLLDPYPYSPSDTWNYRSSQNGEGGDLDGIELQFQTPLDLFGGPGWLSNFGIKMNYSDINSEVNYGTAAAPNYGRLTGQSDNSYNFTFWYENDSGWEARISSTERTNYATRNTSRLDSGGLYGEDINDGARIIDAKVSYQINDSLSISLDILNLTDEPEDTLMGNEGVRLLDTRNYAGTQYYLGVQYTFF